jgi:GMP synthase (glutamine-hydrolysing)
MPKILVIDSNPADLNAVIVAEAGHTIGQGYAEVIRGLAPEAEITIVAPYDGETCPDPAGFDGVVFTGSSVAWTTDDPRAEPLAQIMRATFAAKTPTLGSCNGMQLAASVLGGASQASPNGREDGLARDIRLTEAGQSHPMMQGRRDGYAVPCVHRDEVTALPEGAVLLASNAHSRVQAFAYERDGLRFWGMQYHPEFTPAFVGAYTGANGRIGPEEAADMAVAETDPAAAARLGTTCAEQRFEGRTLEIRNWLASL